MVLVTVKRKMGKKIVEPSAFDFDQIVGIRGMDHFIFEIVQTLRLSRTTASRVYGKYVDSGKTIADKVKYYRQQRVGDKVGGG